ncbi:MAG: LysR family transcriptional regulator, partial [Rhodospirillales bacterium]|nr:LysR family transcriptional regulator [Rhodospirillales bacterium]
MARTLPPLSALRAFESAARNYSFTMAAEELHVTQSAISHQVKSLETYLGRPLFRRLGRSLVLTDVGQVYFPTVRRALDDLAAATDRLFEMDTGGVLTVGLTASVASKWLVHLLPQFQARHPGIDVRLVASDKLVDFNKENVDLCIRQGFGKWPGIESRLLIREYVTPICGPALLSGKHPLREPADLK